MNWSARGNVLNQYLRNTSIGTTVNESGRCKTRAVKRANSELKQVTFLTTRTA